MAFTASGVFRQWLGDALAPTASFAGKFNSTDVYKAALYGTSGTPDKTVSAALSAYNAGQWVTGNEVTSANWPAGGIAITGTGSGGGYTSTSSAVTFDGVDTPGSGTVTITNAYGDLVYDSTLTTPVANQGLAFHYFGGAQSVTSGTFTITWNASGIVQVTV